MKKNFLITILIIIFSIFCVTKIFKSSPNDETVFWTLQMGDFAPYINEVIESFEKENPNIKIKWIDVPFSEGEKRTLASVLSKNPPDLVNLNPDFSATLAQKGALWQIPTNNLMNQFNNEILNSLLIKDKLYSIPWYATSSITIYNKKFLKNPPKTYDELSDLAWQIRKKNAYITLPNITENDAMLKILNKYGCTIENLADCNNVFSLYEYLYKNDLIPKETITTTLAESLEKYMSENIALIDAGANFLNMIKENAPSTYNTTDISSQLIGNIGQYNFSLMNFVIPLRAKHKNEALKFALFLTNEKNQLELAKLTNIIAVNKKTLKNDFYTKYEENDLISKARFISAKQLNKLQPVYKTVNNQKEINNIINTSVQNMLLGNSTIDLIIKNTQLQINEMEDK